MKHVRRFTAILLALLLSLGLVPIAAPPLALAAGSTYYVDASRADDSGNGLSPSAAWKSLGKVNSTTFQPGDRLLFKTGGVWTGQLWPKGSGAAGSPIVIDQYGTGSKPVIHGAGNSYNQTISKSTTTYNTGTVLLKNQEYWEINNLEVTNDEDFATDNNDTSALRGGIYFVIDSNESDRLYSHIYIQNCYVHDVDSYNNAGSKENGAIIGVIKGTSATSQVTKARFDDLRVVNNTIDKVDRVAIRLAAHANYVGDDSFSTTATYKYGNWNTNVYIANNVMSDVGGDGIILRDTDGAVVEYNTLNNFSKRISSAAAGIWTAVSKNSVFQYNEVYGGPASNQDGCAYDLDEFLENDVYQYNYSHDNPMGFMLFMGTNKNDIVRYNVSQNDGLIWRHFAFNELSPAYVYNNVFYYNSASSAINGDTSVKTGYNFYNNIFYNTNPSQTTNWNCTGCWNALTYNKNVFYEASGNHSTNEPTDTGKITADPQFVNPGGATLGLASADAYKLRTGSPALGTGKVIANNGGKDYFGNTVSATAAPNIGIYNGAGLSVTAPSPSKANPIADAYVRDGSYAGNNYGSASILGVKSETSSYNRKAYLKFDVSGYSTISSAKLRLYGGNGQNFANVNAQIYGTATDSWSETGLTWNNAPLATTGLLQSMSLNSMYAYREVDVTSFVQDQLTDGAASFIVQQANLEAKLIEFFSKESSIKPQLIIVGQQAPVSLTKSAIADAYVRDGSYAAANYGSDTTLVTKDGTSSGYTRKLYLKFNVSDLTNGIQSAKLRLYGGNVQDSAAVTVQVYGSTTDSWVEASLNWNNAPAATTSLLAAATVNYVLGYQEFDVTSFVQDQLMDGTVTLLVQGANDEDKTIQFNSRENTANKPQLVMN
ncbi:DNRLRE domain-containing protein [Paenibacillus sp. SYP-B3998]|uniref:CBM96 family carbohydrate-binding protein n=1 Tax=Paenibacillus sp. SYP-B3998 TaxID=2678564 RepID=UPI001F08771F|nr:DNRLRE domain-containing protein [Paenibacillus sp. SYP-B3998]